MLRPRGCLWRWACLSLFLFFTTCPYSVAATSNAVIHFRPGQGVLGDTIPFYWDGVYHVFYLKGSGWGHITSRDLVHWESLQDALEKGGTDAPDGENCWTGSVVEHEGVFHLFYTGKNSRDPKGDQKVMHAVSKDLVQWEKQPEDTFYADGAIYWSKPVNGPIDDKQIYHHQAFRDPEVSWMPEANQWRLLLHAQLADGSSPAFARYTSTDLRHWTPQAPLLVFPKGLSGDCPQLFPEKESWYLIAADRHYTRAAAADGPYSTEMQPYDCGELFVPKTLFDGKRRILMGWIADRKDGRDSAEGVWGGIMCLPREVYADAAGRLCQRPAAEVTAAFTRVLIDRPGGPAPGDRLTAGKDYMLHARLTGMGPGARATFTFRHPPDDASAGYRLNIDGDSKEITLGDRYRTYKRVCDFPAAPPVDVRAFVLGTVIECFINDAYAFTMRALDRAEGGIGVETTGAGVKVQEFTVSTLGK